MQKSRSGHIIEFKPDSKKIEELMQKKAELGDKFPKFGILVLSYNASQFIEKTIDRIPKEAYELIDEIFVFDDNSPDNTYDIASGLKKNNFWKEKLSVFKNPRNLRYGGNQKVGYKYAIDKGLDYVIMLHGDGQYAPEYIPDLMYPAVMDNEQVVFASRMINKKDALKGGMPFYKFIGNQILTRFENLILGTKLYEFHSGYRMYSTKVLNRLPIEENTNEFHFDTEIIIQCRHLGITIKEVPIKTFYGDEECNVDGIRYAIDVVKAVLTYRLHQLHIIRKGSYIINRNFVQLKKRSPYSSHEMILRNIRPESKVLYLGGANGLLYNSLKEKKASVLCVDQEPIENIKVPKEDYIQTDLEELADLALKREMDYIVLSDVLSFLKTPEKLLQKASKHLKEDGSLIVSVPNITIWFYRLSLFIGRFNYSERGVLDKGHLRFFTKFSIQQLLERNGFNVTKVEATSIPFERVFESIGKSRFVKLIDWSYFQLVKIWHKLFAYQFIITAKVKDFDLVSGEGKL